MLELRVVCDFALGLWGVVRGVIVCWVRLFVFRFGLGSSLRLDCMFLWVCCLLLLSWC